jgi:hypothetical protein
VRKHAAARQHVSFKGSTPNNLNNNKKEEIPNIEFQKIIVGMINELRHTKASV